MIKKANTILIKQKANLKLSKDLQFIILGRMKEMIGEIIAKILERELGMILIESADNLPKDKICSTIKIQEMIEIIHRKLTGITIIKGEMTIPKNVMKRDKLINIMRKILMIEKGELLEIALLRRIKARFLF